MTALGIARNTVAAVFERLQAEGYVTSRSGSGMRVSDQLPDELLKARWLPVAQAPMATPAGGCGLRGQDRIRLN